ncbi:MAG: methyltransferase [Candidatus Aminicenantes bacterium]|nr:methyltransferase [Candidatus Aminicenantes bacterium]NIM84919.1 methyltransferase [Candidatus Aminicenantes bacterium]NIN24430.1 methyltransferase [Candidatus Aminicenantes bacterium]NIN48194.1 methyltransferase [Candidatus Aminicenantes bacterium]NIN91097.1 methyltransferase [Candidatus Aminicenantes bacterium]
MKPRKKVQKTLEFDSPPGIPRQAWVLPWAEEHYPEMVERLREEYPDDLVNAPAVYKKPLPVKGDRYKKGTYVDEWGCVFSNLQDGIIGIVKEPLIKDWKDLVRFKTPDYVLDLDKDEINGFCRHTDRFVLAGTFVRPFERLGFIRTLEQALVDLLEQRPELFDLLHRIHELYIKEVEAWAETEVDAICLMDDWGTQQGLMIAPDLWESIFKPMYRDYAEIAGHYGKYVFMHSDGYIIDIIPGLIEVGINALNSQVACMGVEELGKRFRGKLTFWGEIDRQNLLPNGSLQDIRDAVFQLLENLYDDGGVIAQCEFGPGAKPENVLEVFKTWNQFK